jgi:hypothetical protein
MQHRLVGGTEVAKNKFPFLVKRSRACILKLLRHILLFV